MALWDLVLLAQFGAWLQLAGAFGETGPDTSGIIFEPRQGWETDWLTRPNGRAEVFWESPVRRSLVQGRNLEVWMACTSHVLVLLANIGVETRPCGSGTIGRRS